MTGKIIREFFRAADQRDPAAFVQRLTEDVIWRFGNLPATRGRAAVRDSLTLFFQHVREMSHHIVGIWSEGGVTTAETHVKYHDQFGRRFEFPSCNIFFLHGDLICEVRIFVDNHELFLPPPAN